MNRRQLDRFQFVEDVLHYVPNRFEKISRNIFPHVKSSDPLTPKLFFTRKKKNYPQLDYLFSLCTIGKRVPFVL